MPELPEVEVIKRQLVRDIKKQRIISASKSNFRLRKPIPDLSILQDEIILDIIRRNKYLLIITDNYYIIIHLGMSGKVIVAEDYQAKHIHAILNLETTKLFYEDARRFGIIDVLDRKSVSNINDISYFKNLGIEPLSDSFTVEALKKILNSVSIPMKKFAMDAQYICGIGNIYASEILFSSRINPLEKSNNLTEKQIKDFHYYTIKILNQAISLGGSTISDFVHTNGSSGKMQDFYNVYGKKEQPCNDCSSKILQIKQNGRSTFYCENCQKLN